MNDLTDAAGSPHSRNTSIPAKYDFSRGCDTCPFHRMEFCHAVMGVGREERRLKAEGSVRPRQHIYKSGEARGQIVVLRDGWAIRFVLTPDGRRQVLSILLPGDIAGGEFLMRNEARVSV